MQSKKTKELIKRTQTLSLATAMLVTSLNFPVISVRAEDNEQTTTEIEQVIDDTNNADQTEENTNQTTGADQAEENKTENKEQTENKDQAENKEQTEENKEQTTEEQTEENKEQTTEEQTEENKEQTTENQTTEDQTEENEEEVSDEVLDDEATTLADDSEDEEVLEKICTITWDAGDGVLTNGKTSGTVTTYGPYKMYTDETGEYTGTAGTKFSGIYYKLNDDAIKLSKGSMYGYTDGDNEIPSKYIPDAIPNDNTKFFVGWIATEGTSAGRIVQAASTNKVNYGEYSVTWCGKYAVDQNLRPCYQPKLKFDANGGQFSNMESIRYTSPETVQGAFKSFSWVTPNFEIPSNGNKTFLGWSTTPSKDDLLPKTLRSVYIQNTDDPYETYPKPNTQYAKTLPSGATLYAIWEDTTVTVNFEDTDGTEISSVEADTSTTLENIKPSAPAKTNKLFLGWSTDGTEANIVDDTTTFTSNTTLIAVYAEYNKVTYTLYNDGSAFPDGTTASKTYSYKTFIQGVNDRIREADVKYSDMIEVIPVREGYIFCGWTSTKNQNYGDVTTDTSNYLNGTAHQSTSHTGTDFWSNYNNNKNKTVMEIYDSVTVYPVWTKAITFNACGGNFSNNQSTTYSTHDMVFNTYTDVGGNRQQTLWQNKCPVPTRDGYQFVCWLNIKPTSNTDFSNTYRLNYGQSGINAVIVNEHDWYAYVKNNTATEAKGTNDDGAEVYALWVPTYTKVIYHLDGMELDGTLQDNGLDGVTDYIDDSDPDDIKIIQYVPWYTDLNYQYSFKSNGRPLNVQWYKSRNFNVTEDYIGNLIPKQEKDIDVYAKQSVDVIFDLNYDGHKQTKTFDKNTNITPIEDPEREVRIYNEETGTDDVYYYTFKGWYTNAECSGSAVDFSNLKATKETTYYAKWVEPKINHTVTFIDDVDGSTIDTQTVERNKTVTKPTYTGGNSYFHQDLMFLGWSETSSRYNIFDFTTPITDNKTLHAVYADAITVEFIDSYDGQTVETKKIAKDSKVSEPSFRGNDPDRRFVGWSEIGSVDHLFDFTTVISDSITLYSAYAEPLPKYTVTFKDSLGPEFEVIESKIVTENDRVEAPVFNHNHPNKVFIGWSKTRNDTDNLFDFNTGITENIELFAVYKDSSTPVKQTFTVTFNTDGGSLVNSQTVEKGNKVVKPANPTKEGYTFDCWTIGLLEFNFNTAINQNITLTARWTRNADPSTPVVKHTVKFIDWDGTVLKTEVVEDGKDATAPTNPVRNGYTFTGWDKGLSNIKDDMEIKAQYTKNTDPTTPEPTKPEPTKPEPTKPEPTKPEPTKPEPTPVTPEPTKPEPTPVTPVEPEPTQPEPTPTEPTQPKDEEEIIPIIENEPESEEEPTDSEEDEQVEDNIIPEIVVNEVTPEDDPAPIYVGDNNSDKETNATALGKFVEAVKVVAVSVVISLAALSGLLGLLLLIILWMKRIKVLNDRNTDEYNEEKFEVVYRTSVKSEGSLISELQKQENRVWTITIPDEIINERVTDEFKVELKKLFCKRYNGEQLIIKLGESEDARQIGKTIDEKENTVEFTFTE